MKILRYYQGAAGMRTASVRDLPRLLLFGKEREWSCITCCTVACWCAGLHLMHLTCVTRARRSSTMGFVDANSASFISWLNCPAVPRDSHLAERN